MIAEPNPQGKALENNSGAALGGHVVTKLITALTPLDGDERRRVLQAVATYFELDISPRVTLSGPAAGRPPVQASSSFSENRAITPKEFLLQKGPQTDAERVACLAYYLTHYRDMPHFKTLDISKLNTEAAQVKFSNPTWAANNAAKLGYLVPATKGNKQLSAAGEQFVIALPDRQAARAVMANARPRRKSRRIAAAAEDASEEQA